MLTFRQSTASQEIPLGPFVDANDGFTEETALTIANTDIKIWKTGATNLVDKNSGGATHMAKGVYSAVLDATDTNTIGPMVVTAGLAGARPIRVECEVLSPALFDSMFGTVGIKADIAAVNTFTDAAARLSMASLTTVTGLIIGTGSTTTAVVVDAPSPAPTVVDQWKGRWLVFAADTLGRPDLRGQARRITANTAGATPTITVEPALTIAPTTGDSFAIIGHGGLFSLGANGGIKADLVAIANIGNSPEIRLGQWADSIVIGVVASGTTTSITTAVLDPAVSGSIPDQLKGRRLVFNCDTATVALRGQSTRILASSVAGVLTVEPMTAAPAVTDVFTVQGGYDDSVAQIADVAARLPAALTAGGHVKASVEAVKESTQAASHLKLTQLAVASGSLAGGNTTTVLQLASITPTPTVTDQLRGRVILFVDDAASQASMKIQGGRIVASTSTSVTIEQALTSAPVSGNVFVIV